MDYFCFNSMHSYCQNNEMNQSVNLYVENVNFNSICVFDIFVLFFLTKQKTKIESESKKPFYTWTGHTSSDRIIN